MKKNLSVILFIMIFCSGAGYKGTLPNINGEFEYLRPEPAKTSPLFNANQDFLDSSKYKSIPRDNKAYLDIILKKDKTSPYIDDINDVIKILEKMRLCIKKNGNVQKFNALASAIIDNADYMQEKYGEKPERFYISYKKLQELSAQARAVATLRCEAQIYIKYLPYKNDGQVYNKDNIQRQINYFAKELDNALAVLKASN